MKTAVAPDGTVEIPKPIYNALGLKAGAEIDWELQSGRAVIHPVVPPKEITRRMRERARNWKLKPGENVRYEAEERQREIANDRREGRA
ncbi:MAG TPA: AbrB/MazE/SpoVT family DNA-binding domain-containing protein [Candidatus Acidoferrum sp.]|nr:AbrB/MazE/SpoVT family DNA-binding domain-containing protein [Candidatus Acidoferrum sp.]